MARIVMKFGGTSMAGTERIRRVANIVRRQQAAGHEVAVVVSAMAGETDRLVNFCREANALYDPAEYDVVVASGEQVTMNGHEAIILYQEPGYSHVIFPHPLRPNTWVIFTDWVTTFPGREAQGTTAVPTWQLLLNSLYFHQ